MNLRIALALLASLGTLLAASRTSPKQAPGAVVAKWDFEATRVGTLPPGAEAPRGSWEVREVQGAPAGPKALVQTARNHGATFNLIVLPQPQAKDLDLQVQMKALEGREDQGGGLLWRFRDAGNYYVARANPLENNFRVYEVVGGTRRQLQSASVAITPGWHRLRVVMRGSTVECFLDGKSYLKIRSTTFPDAGRVGLWTKADAVTAFDDLVLSTP